MECLHRGPHSLTITFLVGKALPVQRPRPKWSCSHRGPQSLTITFLVGKALPVQRWTLNHFLAGNALPVQRWTHNRFLMSKALPDQQWTHNHNLVELVLVWIQQIRIVRPVTPIFALPFVVAIHRWTY